MKYSTFYRVGSRRKVYTSSVLNLHHTYLRACFHGFTFTHNKFAQLYFITGQALDFPIPYINAIGLNK